MKNLVLLLSVLVILCSCKSDKEYKMQASETINVMEGLIKVCDSKSELYISIWEGVIVDKWYNGEYCDDFNVALQKEIERNKDRKWVEKSKLEMDEKFNLIKDVPESCKESYDELISLYTDASEYAKLADIPEGSLKSYTEKMRGLKDTLTKGIEKFKLKYLRKE